MAGARRAMVLALVAAVTLTACAPGVALRTERGIPDGLAGGGEIGAPLVEWVDRGRTFAVVTWGSSSCPAAATGIDALGDDRVEVTFGPPSGNPCTADMAATTHVFALPDDVTRMPVTVVTVFPADGSTLSLEFTLD